MRGKMMFCAAVLLAALFVTPAHALEYSIDAPSAGDFGAPTSDDAVYLNAGDPNVDRSKNSALVPPGFGTPTSNLPGSGEPLTPNLSADSPLNTATGNTSIVSGVTMLPPTSITGGGTNTGGNVSVSTAYTPVTQDLYYSGGHLGTLKIPALDLSVKVYQGTGSAQLAKGAGHFTDTSIWDGNVAVCAHNRGVNNHFGRIHTLDVGDRITLTTRLGTRTYEVTSVSKISETDRSMLNATADNCLTLFTCVRDEREYRWCVRAVEV